MELKEEFVLDLVRCMTMVDMPMHRLPKFLPFLRRHCLQGGACPHETTVRKVWLPRVLEGHFAALRRLLANRAIWIGWDETTDSMDRSVMNVIVGCQQNVYLVDVRWVARVSHDVVASTVIEVLNNLQIKYGDVRATVSDSAAYCRKASTEVLCPLLKNAKHVPCLCHILALMGDDIAEACDNDMVRFANIFQVCYLFGLQSYLRLRFQGLFTRQAGRRRRFMKWLRDCLPEEMCRFPAMHREQKWRTLFDCIADHLPLLQVQDGFWAQEGDAPNVVRLRDILASGTLPLWMTVFLECSGYAPYFDLVLRFFFRRRVWNLLTWAEARLPLAPLIYDKLMELFGWMQGCVHI